MKRGRSKGDSKEALYYLLLCIMLGIAVSLDFYIGFVIFTPLYFILRGRAAIKKKKIIYAWWGIYFYMGGYTPPDIIAVKGKKAIKIGKRLISYGIIIELVFLLLLMLVYFEII